MQTASKVCKWCMWLVYSLSACFNLLAAYMLHTQKTNYDVVPMLIGCGLMLVSLIVFSVLYSKRWIPLITAVIAGVAVFLLAMDLGKTFSPSIGAGDVDYGLTSWKLLYRHYSMVLVPLLMTVVFFIDRAVQKEEQRQYNASYRSQYPFDGAPVFHDEDSIERGKKKRSVIARERKMREQAEKDIAREEQEKAAAAIPLRADEE